MKSCEIFLEGTGGCKSCKVNGRVQSWFSNGHWSGIAGAGLHATGLPDTVLCLSVRFSKSGMINLLCQFHEG